MHANDAYFLTEPGGTPTSDGRFVRVDEIPVIGFKEGLDFRPVLGEGVLVNHVYFEPYTDAPTHSHVEEQIVIVLDGEFIFWIGGDRRLVQRGDMVMIPPWVPHGGRTSDSRCLEIDVFCPPRRQLLDALNPAKPD